MDTVTAKGAIDLRAGSTKKALIKRERHFGYPRPTLRSRPLLSHHVADTLAVRAHGGFFLFCLGRRFLARR